MAEKQLADRHLADTLFGQHLRMVNRLFLHYVCRPKLSRTIVFRPKDGAPKARLKKLAIDKTKQLIVLDRWNRIYNTSFSS
jgi:hypothetical protein